MKEKTLIKKCMERHKCSKKKAIEHINFFKKILRSLDFIDMDNTTKKNKFGINNVSIISMLFTTLNFNQHNDIDLLNDNAMHVTGINIPDSMISFMDEFKISPSTLYDLLSMYENNKIPDKKFIKKIINRAVNKKGRK